MNAFIINGERFRRVLELEITFEDDWLSISTVPPSKMMVNQCECCGRFDLRERIARSWDEAAEFGWILEERP